MTAEVELDLKQRLSKLSDEDRKRISAYLIHLNHVSDEGRQEISGLMSEMDAGQKTSLSKFTSEGLNG